MDWNYFFLKFLFFLINFIQDIELRLNKYLFFFWKHLLIIWNINLFLNVLILLLNHRNIFWISLISKITLHVQVNILIWKNRWLSILLLIKFLKLLLEILELLKLVDSLRKYSLFLNEIRSHILLLDVNYIILLKVLFFQNIWFVFFNFKALLNISYLIRVTL